MASVATAVRSPTPPPAAAEPPTPYQSVLFEEILERCCGTGRWQALLIGYMSVLWLIVPTLFMSMMFVGATPEFKCADGFDANATFASLPAETPQCHASNDNSSSCMRWVYDDSLYESTVVTEWDLVCGRKPLLSMLQSWLMIGAIIGSPIGGQLSDRFGRRPVFLPAMLLMIVCSFSAALVGDYVSFAVVRFVSGLAIAGMITSQYVLVTELSGCRHRAALTTVTYLPYALSIMLIAAASYGIRTHWLLQLALAAPSLLFLPNFWLMPESPRWLVMQGRFDEAADVLRRGARWNRHEMPPDEEVLKLMTDAHRDLRAREDVVTGADGSSGLQRVLELVRNRHMRKNIIISAYISFAIAGSYFGISFDMTQLSSSPHLAAALSGLAEIPSFFVFPLLNRFGRSRSLSVFLFIQAVAMFLVPAKKNAHFWLALGVFAKLGVAAAFNMIAGYVAEFMPTRQRSLAVGISRTAIHVGGAVSPFMVDLVSGLHETAPSVVFGAVALLASLAALLLPETAGQPMPQTVADVEAAARRKAAPAHKQQTSSNDAFQLDEKP